MAATVESSANSSDQSEDELIKELLDDESPLFLLPNTVDPKPGMSTGSVANKLLSTIYSGPTIEDIKNALSMPHEQAAKSNEHKTCGSMYDTNARKALMGDQALSKLENKYTLKIKSSEHAMADDGYKWRKYGQKSIKNSSNPRSYYRCSNPRCSAKKQVERSTEDPDTLVVTYEGLHLHFAYSHFLPSINPTKRLRTEPPPQPSQGQENRTFSVPTAASVSSQQGPPAEATGPARSSPQGLLEDVVRLITRRTLNNQSSPRSTSSSSVTFDS